MISLVGGMFHPWLYHAHQYTKWKEGIQASFSVDNDVDFYIQNFWLFYRDHFYTQYLPLAINVIGRDQVYLLLLFVI